MLDNDKRCVCGNQLEMLEGCYYCHRCDIDDSMLDYIEDKYHEICPCDYCKGRRERQEAKR